MFGIRFPAASIQGSGGQSQVAITILHGVRPGEYIVEAYFVAFRLRSSGLSFLCSHTGLAMDDTSMEVARIFSFDHF